MFELIGIAFVSWLAWMTKNLAREGRDHSREVNDAVNHIHPDGTQPRLYDLARRNQDKLEAIEDRMDRLTDRLSRTDAHVDETAEAVAGCLVTRCPDCDRKVVGESGAGKVEDGS